MAGPTDPNLKETLESKVEQVYRAGSLENLTVKRIRSAVEEDLKLEADFFKTDEVWKEKSKSIIQAAVARLDEAEGEDAKPSAQIETHLPEKNKPKTEPAPRGTTKRRSRGADESRPRKARKQESLETELESQANPLDDSNGREKNQDRKSPPVQNAKVADDHDSDSDMSSLIDEEPRKKKGDRNTTGGEKTNTKSTKSANDPADPESEEIKSLQGWLVKCGVRKMWYKELAPYDGPRAKIKHLKEMLSDLGMTGRYSKEKAERIRDERELKADLEAVTEGEKTWGKTDDPDSDEEQRSSNGRTRPRLARGLEGLDFLNDDDGEETD